MITNQILLTSRSLRTSHRVDEDLLDRIVGTYSIVIIGLFLFVLTTSYFFGRPLTLISCWCPAEFTGEMTNYANTYCWSSNTYYLPLNNDTLPGRNDPLPAKIGYYQWVPFLLMAMAFGMFIPGFLWRCLSSLSRLELKNTVRRLQSLNSDEHLAANVQRISKQMSHALQSERDYWCEDRALCCFQFCSPRAVLRRNGNYLAACYALMKIMYIGSTVLMLLFLDKIMNFSSYGLSFVRAKPVNQNRHFPYNTLCELRIRGMGDKFKDYLLQCSLPINIFNEKVFGFLWIWLIVCASLSIIGLLRFLLRNSAKSRHNFVNKYYGHKIGSYLNYQVLLFFVDQYCGYDGIFLLRLIEANVREDVFNLLLESFWNEFMQSQKWRFEDSLQHANDEEKVALLPDKPLLMLNSL